MGSGNRTTPRILVEIEADDLDGGYVARIVGVRGCLSQGETLGDALRNIAEAYEGVRDALLALGRELPSRGNPTTLGFPS